MWDDGSPWSAIFLQAAEDDEAYWDDNIRLPAMSWLAHGGRGSPKAREHLVAEALAGGVAALVSEASAPQGAVGAWGQGTRRIKRERSAAIPQQVETEAQAQAQEKLDRHLQTKGQGQGRRKGRKEQRSAPTQSTKPGCSFFLQFGISAAVRAASAAGKLMPCRQSYKCTHVPVGTSSFA